MNPYQQLIHTLSASSESGNRVFAVGEVVNTAPLRVRIGDLEYDEITCLCDMPAPEQADRLLLVSLDAQQSYIALGRL